MSFADRVQETWPADAETILGLIKGRIDPETYPEVARCVGQCYHRPTQHELIAEALNVVLDTAGVEAAFTEGELRPYLEWLNVGDPYVPTLVYYRDKWRVGCYGDYVRDSAD